MHLLDFLSFLPGALARRALVPVAALLSITAATARAEDWSAWSRHAIIYYDASPTGADLLQDVQGFPVLVRLAAPDFDFDAAQIGGEDLRFSKPDGTALPYEIEKWDKAAKRADVWVRLDTVRAGGHGSLMRIHWGNAAASAAGNAAAVFAAADGHAAVWHMGGQYPSGRPNAVGGLEAVPFNYESDEQSIGVIGWADSLDSREPAEYLQTWESFDNLAGGFTYSVWAYPTATGSGARFMDFGNGAYQDNLVLARRDTSNDLEFESHNGGVMSKVTAGEAITLGEWQHFAVTVSGTSARLYRNGVLVASGALEKPLSAARRGYNYIGRSNWDGDGPFVGKLDEPTVAKAARSPDWIRLAYESQKPGSTFLSFTPPIVCEPRFMVPADTVVPEGGHIRLSAWTECADAYSWSVQSGPSARILDPGVAQLDLPAPRVAGDSVTVYLFKARFGDSTRVGTVRVTTKEAIPDPIFHLTTRRAFQDGDTAIVEAVLENLKAIKAGGKSLTWAWSVEGTEVDTTWGEASLILRRPTDSTPLKVRLCLSTNGPEACRETELMMAPAAASLARPVPRGSLPERLRPAYYGIDGKQMRDDRAGVRRFRM